MIQQLYINKILNVFYTVAVFICLSVACTHHKSARKQGAVEAADAANANTSTDTALTLKDIANIPVGVAISYHAMLYNKKYSSIVSREFDNITLQYNMKQAIIVQDDGRFNYNRPDKLVQKAHDAGLNVHGHTLIWYKNVNGKYLRSLVNRDLHAEDSTAVAHFMKNYITQTVNHYKGKITGWDVVNEPIEDGSGAMRTNPHPAKPPSHHDWFYWDQYMGDNYIPLAFRYAHRAAPNATLWINEYNLASDATKRDSLIALVNRLKTANVPIDGIGTQMHISVNLSHAAIDQAFKQLAGTGLLIRISELDVKINPGNKSHFKSIPERLIKQGKMYHYVLWSYMQNVPKKQRAGVTVWNLTDERSWIVKNQGHEDYPTLFNKDYQKKPAYFGLMHGLEGLKPSYLSTR